MSAFTPQLPLWSDPSHRNRGLFADHFLNAAERLQSLPAWKEAAGVGKAMAALCRLYEEKAARLTTRTNEAQTEQDFIRPVLDLLWGSDCYQVQPSIPNVDGRRQPDYALFLAAADRAAAEPHQGTLDYWRNAVALADAKRWTAPLDRQRGSDGNPSAQVCHYLYRSRVRWGILTNGRLWRLYEREKSSAGGIYYEVDLVDLLQRGDPEAFKYFYLFFRREAFVPGPEGLSFVEQVFQGSVEYATEVGNRLKESVYDALRLLMNGFFEYEGNGLDRNDPDTVKLVHENSLIVLYRLLFLLYAEDRGLLPRQTEPYASYSLYRLQREIHQHLRSGQTYPPQSRRFWGELTNLFALIDNGFPEGGIPAYNGGLFSPTRYPHIAHTPLPLPSPGASGGTTNAPLPSPAASGEGLGVRATRWEIGDHRLAEVVDLLAYERDRWDQPGSRDVDYATLQVQHLGSIYEGLLELQPRLAAEPLVETVQEGRSVFKPVREVPHPDRPIRGQPPRRIEQGEVYLVTNRGERKATGSYYTPKYIVDYIVENTIGPLADEAAKQVAALRPEVDREIRRLEKRSCEFADNAAEVEKARRGIEEQKRRLLEPYLSLKILDPAMGSGHFLVGAADFLSLAMATDPNLPEELHGTEDPQTYYKRLIVERCLYGVDLNPLAVELAKLSLWLHTVSQDKALSFLDHHLRCGNSLIGARLEEDLTHEPPQLDAKGRIAKTENRKPKTERSGQLVFGFTEALTAKHLQYFLDTFRRIVEAPAGDAAAERQKDHWYREMDRVRDRFRVVANCWLASYFGVSVAPEQYERAVQALRGGNEEWQTLTQETWFQAAQSEAARRRFFHWELEFPEVFFDAHGFKPKEERGFDAVVGNPPYGLIGDVSTKQLVQQTFASAQYQPDNYVAFMEQTYWLTRQHGYQGLIVPTTFLAMHYFSAIRRFLLDHCRLDTLVHFKFPVFEGPTVESAIYICQSEPDCDKRRGNTLSGIVVGELEEFVAKRFEVQTVPQARFEEIPENDFNISLGTQHANIVEKMRSGSVEPLGCLCEMAVGVKPYQTGKGTPKQTKEVVEKRIFDAKYRKDDTYRQYLMGRDIGRYLVAPLEERWISYGEWLAEPRPGAPFFEPKRIVVRQTGDSIIAALEEKQRLTLNNVHNLRLKQSPLTYEYLLAILNSRLITYFHQQVVPEADRVFAEVKIVDLERFPIRRIAFTTPPGERARLVEEGKRAAHEWTSNQPMETVAYADFLTSDLGRWLDERLPPLADPPPSDGGGPDGRTTNGEQSDVVHDLLAHLAEQMIALNKEKQAEVQGFLTWLEREIGAKVDDLSNKTKIKAYHEGDFDALLGVLRQNRRKLQVNPDVRDFQEAVEREFAASLAKLTPLKARLAATDRLIDLIVYRLYGLTEEEVAMVEGMASG